MHFRHTPSQGSVSNKLDLSLSQADLVRTLPMLMICVCHGKKKLEAESGTTQEKLSFSFHDFSLGCVVA